MINNFDQILKLMDFRSDDDFYFLQIIKRKKEHPDLPKSVIIMHVFYIKSKEELLDKKDEIIHLCEYYKARAYISINRKSFEKTAFQTLKIISDSIMSKEYRFIRKAFNSACGKFSNESSETKKWIIDIDEKLDNDIFDYIGIILNNIEPKGDKVITIIDTKNGHHLITKPFNVQEFSKYYPNFDIHKDNPTILYSF